MANERNVTIVPPSKYTGIKEIPLKDAACGVPAITSTMYHISEELGLWKGMKTLLKLNQKHGVDCPGCAWPDPDDHRSALGEYCENGAKAIAEEATDKKCTPEWFSQHSVEEISSWSDYEIGKSGRVTHPMFLAEGELYYKPISWQAAFDMIAEELKRTANPHRAVFYTSGRTSNEAAYMYQLMARNYGTNNLPDCSNMCHESSGVALTETIGIGKGTVKLEDIHHAKLILVIGQNPGTNHPRMMSALSKCKGNGGKIVHINPLPEVGTEKFIDPQSPLEILKGGTKLADLYLPVKIGGDMALFQYVQSQMLMRSKSNSDVFDESFIENKTAGFEAWKAFFGNWHLEQLEALTGLTSDEIEPLIDLLLSTTEVVSCWAMGLTQQRQGVATIQEVVNIHLLRGAIGKPNAGVCPVRGHSNVQGDRTMGIYEKPKPAFMDKLDQYWDKSFVREEGYDVVEAIAAMEKGDVDVFIAMGGNFISATPDSERTGKAMQKVGLTVQVSTKLNRAHCVTGQRALILPCLGRTEKDVQSSGEQLVTVENSMGVVHTSRGVNEPCSAHLKSEPAIVSGIAQALFGNEGKMNWQAMADNYDVIRDHIEGSIAGFDQFNQRVRRPEGFYLPNGPREGRFTTPSGKAHFSVNEMEHLTVGDGRYIMMTIRSHDQYNTTIYGLDDRYRGIENERRVVLMNPADMAMAGLEHMAEVNISSWFHDQRRVAEHFLVIQYPIARGCVATYFPETNCLVPLEHTALKSNTPVSKWIEVSLDRVSH
jgi:molybdopterin-dependent oxidoreductase alpha subunit